MLLDLTRHGAFVLRLLAVAALLGCPRMGSAQGTWSIISLPLDPAEMAPPKLVALDSASNLYVVDTHDRIWKRDAQGIWSILATAGTSLGQVDGVSGLAADIAGNLYVAEDFRIQKRDAQGNWSVLAGGGDALGQVNYPAALAVDTIGNLYVADVPGNGESRIQRRDAQGIWTVLTILGDDVRQLHLPVALAVDPTGNLYVADYSDGYCRIQRRDTKGNWSLVATRGFGRIQIFSRSGFAVDAAGCLYLAQRQVQWDLALEGSNEVLKRDVLGGWSVVAGSGAGLGQVDRPSGLAVDGAGNLFVADTGNSRVQKYTPAP